MSRVDPADEPGRLATLRSYAILDTPPEKVFDDLARLAAHMCGTPVSLVSLVDADRTWFKARVGLDATEVPRDVSFCTHAIQGRSLFVVPDATADPRFASNPLVVAEPPIRFYAGAPLVGGNGYALGTLCVIDRAPRELTPQQRDALRSLARLAAAQIEARRTVAALALSESRARTQVLRFASLLEATIAYSIIGTDGNGVIDIFNKGAERMLGYAAEEVVGIHTPVLIHDPEELAARARELGVEPGFEVFVAAARQDELETRDWTYVRKDRTRLPVELTVTTMRDAEGQPTGFIGIASNISERKAAERERERLLEAEREAARALAEQNARLRELDAIKSELVSVVSHELRTPLTSIRGFVEILRGGEPGPLTEEQEHFLAIVERNVGRLLRVVSDLLFVARVDSGTLTLEVGPVDLAQIAREVVEGAQPFARRSEVVLELDVDRAPTIEGDEHRLNQLLDNLVANAIKFTPAGGRVRVRAVAENGAAVIEVADSGIGIAAEEQGQLFERFYRATSATERAIPGTGLGLTIVKAIAEAHGGTIGVESEPGRGTTFRVELPAGHREGES